MCELILTGLCCKCGPHSARVAAPQPCHCVIRPSCCTLLHTFSCIASATLLKNGRNYCSQYHSSSTGSRRFLKQDLAHGTVIAIPALIYL